jgi:hypothetical protein
MRKGTIAGIIVAMGVFGLSAFVSKRLRERPTILSVFRED